MDIKHKRIVLLIIMLVVSISVFFLHLKLNAETQPRNLNREEAKNFELHDQLVEIRLQMVSLMTEDNTQEILDYLDISLGKYREIRTKHVLGDPEGEVVKIENYVETAIEQNEASKEDAKALLVDLTNLILRYREKLVELGFQFPPQYPQL